MRIKYLLKDLIGTPFYNLYYKYKKPVGNRVLIYHAFGSRLDHDTYGISIHPKLFKEHLIYLKDNYTILPLNDDTYKNRLDIDSISISIDDGYKDTLVAVELLEKYNIPYTIYIATGFLNRDQYLSVKDVQDISKSPLCTIGSHTVNHVYLSTLSKGEQYKELFSSKKVLEEITGQNIIHFSYPYGDYNKSAKEIADNLYKMISTSHIGINSKKASKQKIKRIEILAHDTIKKLERKVMGYYDYL